MIVTAVLLTIPLAFTAAADPRPAKSRAALTGTPSSKPITDVPAPDRKGEDWPCFLGSLGTGVCNETNWLKSWPDEGLKTAWSMRVGTGYSAPSVMGNRLVVIHRPRGNEEIVDCLRADNGEPLWQFKYATAH